MLGLIFSIEEFAVFDGDGIRVNVFFKGCPLRCLWCHNPEGWKHKIEIVKNPNGCIDCGICHKVCSGKPDCILCDRCIINCPRGLIRRSGEWIQSEVLAKKLLRFRPLLSEGGGLTFSGGEVLMQADFLCEVLEKTADMHRVIETSGYGDPKKWKKVLSLTDFVYFDLKIMDENKHKEYTGVSNKIILENAKILFDSNVPFTIRIPFIHGVNTDEENLKKLCEFIKDAKNLQKVELLGYNELAGSKYKLLGLEYKDVFQKPTHEDYAVAEKVFRQYNIKFSKEL